ncbi:ABZJ_00895 family protein [Marinobacter sp.]|uniref:ABZJ_00895 family protein n=1 Tax=Marinobacter sp. TaxID=50741 RepID=UPI001B72AF8F|nr:ABZJ_00895 family protein [Marinobacter sp.]MBQ0833076.1 ABZJ_00895 family protein [Marinobacter sp.]
MIIKTILNFSGLYAALQFCVIIIGHVFNFEIPAGAQIGLMIGAAYGAMMTSVSALGRAPSRLENWVLSVSVNLCAVIISLIFLATTLYFSGGSYALQEFMMVFSGLPVAVFSGLPVAVFFVGVGGAFLLQVVFCLLMFGKAARRHLLKVQAEQARVGV